jgi:ABC-type antimicrobial peptide transport system permease subunit
LRRIASQFALRTSIDPSAVALEARQIERELLSAVPIARTTTLVEQLDASIIPERLMATLSGFFGVLGSILAAIGLYGLLAYTVVRRTREIGVRMALGADRANVIRMVLRDALSMVITGLLAGGTIALWSKNFAARLLEGLPTQRALPVTVGALAMITIALLAAWLPARRAAHVDPIEALRHE